MGITKYLGAFICCYIAMILRIPNLKVGTICLTAFLMHDVFMVFLTPFIFGGESIMMEVATAGGRNSRQRSKQIPALFWWWKWSNRFN